MELSKINPPEKTQVVIQDWQLPESEDQVVQHKDLPRKLSKWQRVVDIINSIGAAVKELFQPHDELDRFRSSIEAFAEARWRSFNR